MSEEPKSPKGAPRVPSFDELKGPRPAAEREPAHDAKTATIAPDVLKRILAQASAAGSPPAAVPRSAPPPPGASVALSGTGKLPLEPMAPPAARAIPPGSRPAPTDNSVTARMPPAVAGSRPMPAGSTQPDQSAQARMAAPPNAGTHPIFEQPGQPRLTAQPVRAPPPPPGSRPAVNTGVTEKMPPLTPDMLASLRATPGRPAAPTQVGVPASPSADASIQKTMLSVSHQGEHLPPAAVDAELPGQSTRTEPHARNPFHEAGPRPEVTRTSIPLGVEEQPTRNERAALAERPAPTELPTDEAVVARLSEGPTRSERPSRSAEAPLIDIEEKTGTRTEPSGPPQEPSSKPALGAVPLREVVARPAPVLRLKLAFLIDALVVSSVCTGISWAVLAAGRAPPLPERTFWLDAVALRIHDVPRLMAAAAALSLGLIMAYTTLFAVAASGRTVGRAVAGLHLLDGRGEAPGAGRALLRAVLSLFSLALCGMGFWLALFDSRSQTLHDKLCSTFVVRLRPTRN